MRSVRVERPGGGSVCRVEVREVGDGVEVWRSSRQKQAEPSNNGGTIPARSPRPGERAPESPNSAGQQPQLAPVPLQQEDAEFDSQARAEAKGIIVVKIATTAASPRPGNIARERIPEHLKTIGRK